MNERTPTGRRRRRRRLLQDIMRVTSTFDFQRFTFLFFLLMLHALTSIKMNSFLNYNTPKLNKRSFL